MLLCSDAYSIWQWRERRRNFSIFTGPRLLLRPFYCFLSCETAPVLVTCMSSTHGFLLHSAAERFLGDGYRRAKAGIVTRAIFYFFFFFFTLPSINILDWLFNRWTNVHTAPPGGLV